jgi:DNA-directed RNA polymerase specialized sigma24 family protein
VMRHLLDMRAREIGEVLGLPPSTVRTRLHRSIARLREALGKGAP